MADLESAGYYAFFAGKVSNGSFSREFLTLARLFRDEKC